jgi:hypothetical protein
MEITWVVQGLRTNVQHWIGMAAMADNLVEAAVADTAQDIAREATALVRYEDPDLNTREPHTRDTIYYEVWKEGNQVVGEVGATTTAARMMEFGFFRGGTFHQYPFLMPAADKYAPLFYARMAMIGWVAAGMPIHLLPEASPQVVSTITQMRTFLYSFSRFVGDVQIFGKSQTLQAARGYALAGARSLGDISASMRGALLTRVSHRFFGRFSGYGIRSYTPAHATAQIGGSGALRLYNRFAGRVIGHSVLSRT